MLIRSPADLDIVYKCEKLNRIVPVFLGFCGVLKEACENRFVVALGLIICLRVISCRSEVLSAKKYAHHVKKRTSE